ncbi:MAG: carboxypeptidase M32 [Rickettsiaceae bacterium]
MSNKINNYIKLEKQIEKISHLGNIASLTHWDSATMLKAGSAKTRQQEMATLESLVHEMNTSQTLGDLIEAALLENEFLDNWQKTNLKLIKKSYEEEICITPEMKHEFSIASSESEFTWRECRAKNDFKTLVPYLDRVFKASVQIANTKSQKLGTPIYDTLVDSYDPERKVSEINNVYDVLKIELPRLIAQISEKQASEKFIKLTKPIDENTQKAIGIKVLEKMGFDLDRGRLDKSTHPFCIGGRFDVRLTTRYDESNFLSSLFGVIHETGHGLYQQNLPEKYINQPVGRAKGMAFHESQSLIMDMQACTSVQVTEFVAKLLKDDFNFVGSEYSAENLYKLMTRVKPSFIRVDADEVTYPLHVILRFEIEQEIINSRLKAADLSELWNSKMREYLGIIPDSYTNGCLQDIHWPAGMFGYFPSYTNGAIIASMLMHRAKQEHGEKIVMELSKGDFGSLNNYLNKNLREYGSLKSSEELLEKSTGFKQIDPSIFIDYLKNKYLSL